MSTTALKIIALICMTLDHIGEYIPGAPVWLRWIGRISAPLFIYCSVIGMKHTGNRRAYVLRLYILGVLMSIANSFFSPPVDNNIFTTLFCIAFIIYLWDSKKKLIAFCIFQLIVGILLYLYGYLIPDNIAGIAAAVSGNIFYSEGKLFLVALGVLLFLASDSKKKLALTYSIYVLLYILLVPSGVLGKLIMSVPSLHNIIPIFVAEDMLGLPLWGTWDVAFMDIHYLVFQSFQWMMIAALPLMLLYNGKRGANIKYFFYAFYPAHIYILWAVGRLLSGGAG